MSNSTASRSPATSVAAVLLLMHYQADLPTAFNPPILYEQHFQWYENWNIGWYAGVSQITVSPGFTWEMMDR